MPTRMLRDGILSSRAVNELSPEAELFYWHLLLVVDDYGRTEADPELLSVRCFPRRHRTYDGQMTGRCLTDVSTVRTDDGHPLVTLYDVGNKKYLQINNFGQRMRAKVSKCPSPDGHMTGICPQETETKTESETETNVGNGSDDAVSMMQENLKNFMDGKWGTPDRKLVKQVLDACNGASPGDIGDELKRLHRSGARPGKSWGWFVTMLSRRFSCEDR